MTALGGARGSARTHQILLFPVAGCSNWFALLLFSWVWIYDFRALYSEMWDQTSDRWGGWAFLWIRDTHPSRGRALSPGWVSRVCMMRCNHRGQSWDLQEGEKSQGCSLCNPTFTKNSMVKRGGKGPEKGTLAVRLRVKNALRPFKKINMQDLSRMVLVSPCKIQVKSLALELWLRD